MKKLPVACLICCALFYGLSVVPVLAEVPQVINYQGKLTDGEGRLIEGSYAVDFALFTQASGGEAIWAEEHSAVTVTNGLFNVQLGSVNTGTLGAIFPAYGDLYLEIVVNEETLLPRQRMASVGYALRAESAATAEVAAVAEGLSASALDIIYPVGAVYISVVPASPATLFGGTWEAMAPGRVLVGVDSGDSDFNSGEKTGGAKTHRHSVASPIGYVAQTPYIFTNAEFATILTNRSQSRGITIESKTRWSPVSPSTGNTEIWNINSTLTSSYPKYITVYMWKRIE